MPSDDYHIRIQAPNRPDAFAQLFHSLDVGDEIVWNGRDEACTLVEIEMEQSEPGGIGWFKKRIIVENQNRKNGGRYRLTFKDGRSDELSISGGLDARCHVQRHVGEDGNENGWGRTTDIESLGHVNPVESMSDEKEIVTDGGKLDHVRSVKRYDGDKDCCYDDCDEEAGIAVEGKTMRNSIVRFGGCRSCLNANGIYPIENEWVVSQEVDDAAE